MSLTRADVSPDMEELVDRAIHRAAAQFLVRRLVATPVTPNQITVLACLVGVAASVLIVSGLEHPWLYAAGGAALLLSCILDCVDGQLARARNQQSALGRILDGISDYLVGISVFTAMTYVAVVHSGTNLTWIVGALAGLSIIAHAAIFDAKKIQYLECLGLAVPEEPISALLTRQKAARGSEAFLLAVYAFYRRTQSVGVTEISARDPLQFWQANRGRMRAWTYLGSGTHFFALYCAAVIAVAWPGAFIACALLYVVPMNILYVWLMAQGWKAV